MIFILKCVSCDTGCPIVCWLAVCRALGRAVASILVFCELWFISVSSDKFCVPAIESYVVHTDVQTIQL